MEREATSGYHRLNRSLVRSIQIPSRKCRLINGSSRRFPVFLGLNRGFKSLSVSHDD